MIKLQRSRQRAETEGVNVFQAPLRNLEGFLNADSFFHVNQGVERRGTAGLEVLGSLKVSVLAETFKVEVEEEEAWRDDDKVVLATLASDVQSLVVNEFKLLWGGMSVGLKRFSSLLTSGSLEGGNFGPRGYLTRFAEFCLSQLSVGVM